VVWDTLGEPYIKEIKYRVLTEREEERIIERYTAYMDKWELERAERRLHEVDESSDEEGDWRSSTMVKATHNKETECEKMRRIEAEMIFYAEREECDTD
jgi:hypothetical protein